MNTAVLSRAAGLRMCVCLTARRLLCATLQWGPRDWTLQAAERRVPGAGHRAVSIDAAVSTSINLPLPAGSSFSHQKQPIAQRSDSHACLCIPNEARVQLAAAGGDRSAFCCRYLTLVESLPTYGVHYYEVKVGGLLWSMGIYSGCSWDSVNNQICFFVFLPRTG